MVFYNMYKGYNSFVMVSEDIISFYYINKDPRPMGYSAMILRTNDIHKGQRSSPR